MPSMKRRLYQRWDGDIKGITKNCPKCVYKVNFWENKICAWGKAFKYLVGENPNRKCEYFGKEPPKDNSLEYVLEAKKLNLMGTKKGEPAVIQLTLGRNFK